VERAASRCRHWIRDEGEEGEAVGEGGRQVP
jgi:hypothetical protein